MSPPVVRVLAVYTTFPLCVMLRLFRAASESGDVGGRLGKGLRGSLRQVVSEPPFLSGYAALAVADRRLPFPISASTA